MRSSAHHAFAAEYDENKLVTVAGIVTRFEWTNPHVWLYVDGKDGQKVRKWSVEMGSPNGLLHGLETHGVEDGRSGHCGRVSREGRQQHGEHAQCHSAGWPEAIRGLPKHAWRAG
jgi:hypothetical protein